MSSFIALHMFLQIDKIEKLQQQKTCELGTLYKRFHSYFAQNDGSDFQRETTTTKY